MGKSNTLQDRLSEVQAKIFALVAPEREQEARLRTVAELEAEQAQIREQMHAEAVRAQVKQYADAYREAQSEFAKIEAETTSEIRKILATLLTTGFDLQMKLSSLHQDACTLIDANPQLNLAAQKPFYSGYWEPQNMIETIVSDVHHELVTQNYRSAGQKK